MKYTDTLLLLMKSEQYMGLVLVVTIAGSLGDDC